MRIQREKISCPLCGSDHFRRLYIKRSRKKEPFAIVKCRGCGLILVNSRPLPEDLSRYYSMDYFSKRDDRGYNDYLSDKQEKEVLRVLEMNLRDLAFYPWESVRFIDLRRNDETPSFLDIGAASGLVVSYFQERGWQASGVEVAKDLAEKGRKKYGIKMHIGNFLEIEIQEKFDLITMWATIEHLPYPERFIEKISDLLKPGGRFILTTCRAGYWNYRMLFGRNWRFFNVPEHLFYFSNKQLHQLMARYGLRKLKLLTYGSGLKPPLKKIADYTAKHWGLGDMVAISYEKGMRKIEK